MIRFDEVLGQRGAVDLLRKMLDNHRVPQALLLHGAEAVGKGSVARSFAAALLCESPTPEACGECSSCRLIETGGHPDLLMVERLPRKTPSATRGELRNFIIVEQIRQLSKFAGLAPRQSSRRVFVIDPADRMNAESQNALLKTLEEPPGQSLLILVASRPQLLLPTVRSRTFAISFGPLRPADLAESLRARGMPAQEAMARAGLAGGRPGRALDLELETLLERRETVMEALETLTLSATGAGRLPDLAAALAGKTEAWLLGSLELLESLLRDAALTASGADRNAIGHADLAGRLERLGGALGARRAAELIGAVERWRHDLRLNLNRALVVEGLLAAVAGGPIP